MLRGHGMVRELADAGRRAELVEAHPDLNPDFIFAHPGFNFRSTELNAIIGRSQLPRLDANNARRTENLNLFMKHLDPDLYRTDFVTEGSSNYAFTLILQEPDAPLAERVQNTLRKNGVEFRRGTAGGGNQLRQPYLRRLFGDLYAQFPQVDHVHFYGWYVGNYPSLDRERILKLCELLNGLAAGRGI